MWNEKVETEDRSEPLVAGFLDAIQEYLQKQETVRLNYTSHDLDFEQLSVLAWELILSDSDVADLPGHFDVPPCWNLCVEAATARILMDEAAKKLRDMHVCYCTTDDRLHPQQVCVNVIMSKQASMHV